jgi:hypothetical protein
MAAIVMAENGGFNECGAIGPHFRFFRTLREIDGNVIVSHVVSAI